MKNKTFQLITEKIIEEIKEELFYLCPCDKNFSCEHIEEKYNCSISIDIEKHNSLQYTYFYEIDFNPNDEKNEERLFIEIESGISNGTIIKECDFRAKIPIKTTKIIKVLTDIVIAEEEYENNLELKRAKAILKNNKEKLFEFYRKNNFDEYITGGNSKLEMPFLLKKLALKYIYEEKEVDRNFL